MAALKLIITSKANLKLKYQNKFSALQKLFSKLAQADKNKDLNTKLVYIDDASSAKKFGISPVTSVSEKNCKDVFDAIFKKHNPAYMVIFGAQDVFPFQELDNELDNPDPDGDNDRTVPSDLPYACESPYSKKIASFTNAARVVGRIPDIPGQANLDYVKTLIDDIIKQKQVQKSGYMDYFSVTASVWTKSTQQSIQNIFGNHDKLLICPTAGTGYSKKQLAPLSHFYNCHGGPLDPNFYGQKGSSFPVSLNSTADLNNKISYGTVVAAECCYGAELSDPSESGLSIANNYLLNHALSFMGSSTIAYGPSSGQGLADLICQYFMKCVHTGASTGRALLEARQKFLNVSGPTIDAYELKTIAQFYILGDPSVTLVKTEEPKETMSTIENRRINLLTKGISIGESVAPSRKIKTSTRSKHQKELNVVLKQTGFNNAGKEIVFEAGRGKKGAGGMKKFLGGTTRYRTYQKARRRHDGIRDIVALVVKENDQQLLGWKVYVSR
jgi:hypothetical protein